MGAQLYQDFVDTSGSQTSREAGQGEDDMEVRLARAKGKARAEGFADGAESAEATFDREMLSEVSAVSEALSHFAADRTAADAKSIETLRQILTSALTAFTPSLAEAALPSLVADTVTKALTSELTGKVVVEANPARLDDLKQALTSRDSRISFSEDPNLAIGTARVAWRGGFDQIDAKSAITAGTALLDERLRAQAAPKINRPAQTDDATCTTSTAQKDDKS